MNKYITKFKNIRYVYALSFIIPLIGWIFVLYKFYFKNKEYKNHGVLGLIIVSLPIINIIYNVYINFKDRKKINIASWKSCFSTDLDKKEKENGVVLKWDTKCFDYQSDVVNHFTLQWTERLYYINYIIFMIAIIYVTNFDKQIVSKKDNLFNFIIVGLLSGVIGISLELYTNQYLYSMIYFRFISSIIAINIGALLVVILIMLKRVLN